MLFNFRGARKGFKCAPDKTADKEFLVTFSALQCKRNMTPKNPARVVGPCLSHVGCRTAVMPKADTCGMPAWSVFLSWYVTVSGTVLVDLQSDAGCSGLEVELLCLLLILCISAEGDGVNRALPSCQ